MVKFNSPCRFGNIDRSIRIRPMKLLWVIAPPSTDGLVRCVPSVSVCTLWSFSSLEYGAPVMCCICTGTVELILMVNPFPFLLAPQPICALAGSTATVRMAAIKSMANRISPLLDTYLKKTVRCLQSPTAPTSVVSDNGCETLGLYRDCPETRCQWGGGIVGQLR